MIDKGQSSMWTFIENVVNLGIESVLICDITNIITPASICRMNQEQIEELASESITIQAKREHLRQEVERLAEGFEIIRRERRREMTGRCNCDTQQDTICKSNMRTLI